MFIYLFCILVQQTTDNVVLQWKEFQITDKILLAQYYVNGNYSINGTKKYNIGKLKYAA